VGAPYDALAGGVLIGLAAVLLMAGNDRIAGISGIVAGVADPDRQRGRENLAFILGLLLGIPMLRLWGGTVSLSITHNNSLLLAGGLLVGFGTRLGSGCTSGHGVCGLARLSPRSAAAVGLFMTSAIVTVFVMERFG
jgi:uncharacterized membrane protein YedE/YeeE